MEQRFPLLASQATYDKWTWGSNPECTARFPELAGIPYCLLGPDEPPQVALIGDSHANQYYPGLVEQGLKVINLGKGSCLAFLDVSGRIVRTMKLATQSEGCVVDARTARLYVAEEDVGIWRFDARASGSVMPTMPPLLAA